MWEPQVRQWEFVYVSDYAAGHHYFVYVIEYTEESLEVLSYAVDKEALEFTKLTDEDDIEEQLESTEPAYGEFLVKRWIPEAAKAFKTKQHFKYAPDFIKFTFKIVQQKK